MPTMYRGRAVNDATIMPTLVTLCVKIGPEFENIDYIRMVIREKAGVPNSIEIETKLIGSEAVASFVVSDPITLGYIRDAVSKWYCEDGVAPYPPGTLLYWNAR